MKDQEKMTLDSGMDKHNYLYLLVLAGLLLLNLSMAS
jgi:hypothetical protein